MSRLTLPPQSNEGVSSQPTSSGRAAAQWIQARAVAEKSAVSVQAFTAAPTETTSRTTAIREDQIAAVARKAVANVELKGRDARIPFFKIQGMEKWNGRVVDVDGPMFSAELEPQDAEGAIVTADFNVDLLAPDYQIEAGDLIYVTARTIVERPGYPPTRTVNVRLRRMGLWSEADSDALMVRAKALKSRYDSLFE